MISRRDALKLGAAGMVAPSIGGTLNQPAMAAQKQGGSVPMFRGNAARTGEMPGPGPSLDKPIVVKWKFETEDMIVSSPAVADGTVYVGSFDSKFYALDALTGEELWQFGSVGVIGTSPCIDEDMAYFAATELEAVSSNIYAVDRKSGLETWRFTTASIVLSSPTIANDMLFIGDSSQNGDIVGNMYAIDALSGTEVWRFTGGPVALSSPAVAEDVLYFGSLNNNLFAIDASSGTELWRFSTDDEIVGSPAVSGGTVFIGSSDSNLYAIDLESGAEQWRFTTGDAIESSPAMAEDTVYVGSIAGDFHALDATSGAAIWQVDIDTVLFSSAAIADGIVYMGYGEVGEGNLQGVAALNAKSGEQLWHFDSRTTVTSSPAVVDGVVYVGGDDGVFYAIGNLDDTVLQRDSDLRGAPSSTGVERGTAKAGDAISNMGSREERDGQTWVEVTINDVTGWIPLDAIDPATLPPEGEIEYVYIPE